MLGEEARGGELRDPRAPARSFPHAGLTMGPNPESIHSLDLVVAQASQGVRPQSESVKLDATRIAQLGEIGDTHFW